MLKIVNKLFSPIGFIVVKIQRGRLRQSIRGYRKLRSSGELGRIADVKQDLTEHMLGLGRKNFSSIVMGCGIASGEIVVRQFLLLHLGGISLNRALLSSLGKVQGKVVYPLPKVWREILVLHKFEVDHFKSALLWQFYIFTALLYGIAKICMIAFFGIYFKKKKVPNDQRTVYFVDLNVGHLPKNISGGKSYDVISWYLQWPGRDPDINLISHGVTNSSSVGNLPFKVHKRPLPELVGWVAIMRYCIWGCFASIIAVLDCLRGRWWHALLLNQSALAAQVRTVPKYSLAKEYLFHNSSWIYRPLWTYEAERLGSTITFYFYSANCEGYKQPSGYPPSYIGYKAMNWPRYLVWDEFQADFVRRVVGVHSSIYVVGSIWFQDSFSSMPLVHQAAIAVFDMTPQRSSRYYMHCEATEILVPAAANKFLLDASSLIQQHDVLMLWKRKRNIGRLAHPQYRNFATKLAESSHIVLIEPDISAMRVIEASVAVISMPFTSTALIAREMGKPSVYYDPTGLVQKDDRAAHGIEVLSNSDELNNWMNAVLGTGN